MSVFLNANFEGNYSHYRQLEKDMTVISKADPDISNVSIYYESIFDKHGVFFYNRILTTIEATKNDGISLIAILVIE